ncbi:hypothetical protein CEXT_340671 [Caerostris extrusa]|uniref:Uncharacterized protein n=1 Tax=Caerostris extrusa TaxID=172846 RepID=A0AAV4TF16_CAEEX|nr:hypothetical protein CEXT_340671 [Caerostris extrusa]
MSFSTYKHKTTETWWVSVGRLLGYVSSRDNGRGRDSAVDKSGESKGRRNRCKKKKRKPRKEKEEESVKEGRRKKENG